jgi:hypothetical protein
MFLTGPHGLLLLMRLGVSPQDAAVFGTALAVLGVVLGYALVMVGQLRCFAAAPRDHGARRIQLASVLCFLAAPLCLAGAALCQDGASSYAALSRGPGAVLDLDFMSVGVVLQVAGAALIVLGLVLFGGFALAVGQCLRDPSTVRAVTRFYCCVGFLLGGTVGLIIEARRTSCPEALVALPLGWLVCLLWHTLLIRTLSRRVVRGPQTSEPQAAPLRLQSQANDEPALPTGPYGYNRYGLD